MQLDVAHPYVLAPGEGELVTDRPQRTLRILADREELVLTWFRYEPGEKGPDPHIHRRHTDAFYVLEGELEFGLGPDVTSIVGRAGTLAAAPAGVVHTFRNSSDRTALFLNIHAPGMGFAAMLRARPKGLDDDVRDFDQYDPPPDGGRPLADAVVRGPGEGPVAALGASRALFKMEVADGEGTFSLTETTLAPGFPGPVVHRHAALVDSFFVLDGTLTLRLGNDELEAGPGSYALVPPGTVHTFANRGESPVRVLNLMAPAGFEQYLKEAATAVPSGSPPDPAVLAGIAARYDFEPIT